MPDPFREMQVTDLVNRLQQEGRAEKDLAAAKRAERVIPPFFLSAFSLPYPRLESLFAGYMPST